MLAKTADRLRASKIIPAVEVPRGLFGAEKQIETYVLQAKTQGIEDIMIHNVGLVPMMKKLGMKRAGGALRQRSGVYLGLGAPFRPAL